MANSIQEKLQTIIDKSNETTGKTDTDLTSAVKSLKEGYGNGGNTSGMSVTNLLVNTSNLTPTATATHNGSDI